MGWLSAARAAGAADLHRERAARYQQDRESWRPLLREYQGYCAVLLSERDGWWSLDDPAEYDELTYAAGRSSSATPSGHRPPRLCPEKREIPSPEAGKRGRAGSLIVSASLPRARSCC
jgi:hypothetical protein